MSNLNSKTFRSAQYPNGRIPLSELMVEPTRASGNNRVGISWKRPVDERVLSTSFEISFYEFTFTDPLYGFVLDITNCPSDTVVQYFNYKNNESLWPDAYIISKSPLTSANITATAGPETAQTIDTQSTIVESGETYYYVLVDFNGHDITPEWPVYEETDGSGAASIYASGGNATKIEVVKES